MTTRSKWLMLTTCLLGGMGLLAQAPPPPPPEPPELTAGPKQGHQDEDNVWAKRREKMRRIREERMELDRGPVKGPLMRLKRENPEEYERLSNLYREDRQAFMQEVRELMKERGEMGFGPDAARRDKHADEVEKKCRELSRLYHDTDDKNEKARIKAELEQAVTEAFEIRLEYSRKRIEHLERQLVRFKERIESLEKNRETICKDRLDQLTRPPELRWDSNW